MRSSTVGARPPPLAPCGSARLSKSTTLPIGMGLFQSVRRQLPSSSLVDCSFAGSEHRAASLRRLTPWQPRRVADPRRAAGTLAQRALSRSGLRASSQSDGRRRRGQRRVGLRPRCQWRRPALRQPGRRAPDAGVEREAVHHGGVPHALGPEGKLETRAYAEASSAGGARCSMATWCSSATAIPAFGTKRFAREADQPVTRVGGPRARRRREGHRADHRPHPRRRLDLRPRAAGRPGPQPPLGPLVQ